MPNSIRPATNDDLDRICEIESASNSAPWSRAAISSELAKPHSYVWVITDDETDETIFAFAVFSFLAEQTHLLEIAVDPRLRKHGFGGYLLRGIINFTLRQGGESVFLEVRKSNANATAFYQHLGFVVVHAKTGHYSDGEDAYSMCFKLKEAPPEAAE